MLSKPKEPEIDVRTTKLLVGVIAMGLPMLTSGFAHQKLTSISESYFAGGWSQTFFIGFLFAIAAFLLSYNGYKASDKITSRVAAFAAMGVALYPCDCEPCNPQPGPHLHYFFAGVMFAMLAYLCFRFYQRAMDKRHAKPRARWRAAIYAFCGLTIVAAMIVMAIHNHQHPEYPTTRFVFWGETIGLEAFGFSWLLASHVLPWINGADEWFWPGRTNNPPAER